MSNVKLGFQGHDANLIHHVPSWLEKRWILSLRWCKQIDKDWIYAGIVFSLILGTVVCLAMIDGIK